MRPEIIKEARVLVVDDEGGNLRLLEKLLQKAGYAHVRTTTDAREVVAIFDDFAPDLILLDLHMPEMDGFAVMEQLRPKIPEGTYLPILVLTADITPEAKRRALLVGAKDFLTKPFDSFEAMLRVWNLLEARFLYLELQRQLQQPSRARLEQSAAET